MNTPILVVACINAFAVVAHVFGGTKDSVSISPVLKDKRLVLNWKQSMCAFQMLAIDLLAVTVVLFMIALTDIITFERELTLLLSILYFLWGLVWFVQMFWLKSSAKEFSQLPQWLFWFVCSGLLYWGA